MKKRLLVLFLIGILVIAGLAWFWLDSGRVVNKAIEKLTEANTQSFSGVMTSLNKESTKQLLGEQAFMEITVSGFFERQFKGWDSLVADVKITTETESVTLRIEGKLIFIGDQAYVKVIKAPPAFPELVQLKDVWIALPRGGDNTTSQLNSNENLFTNIKRIGKERIGKEKITMYQAKADQTAILHILDGVAGLLGTRLSAEQIAGFREQVKNTDSANVELGIAPWTHDLHYFATVLTTPNSNEITLSFTLKDRNEPVDIAAPANSILLDEILSATRAQNTNTQSDQ
jgi:hypothetical protein